MKQAILRRAIQITGILISGQAAAQGYYVDEQSALRLGDAFSGGAASASDASTAYYGPAAMVLVNDELAINLAAISVKSELKGSALTYNAATDSVAPISGKDAEADAFDLLPTLYYVHELSDGVKFGVYLNAPYATGTDFGDDSIARYQTTESEITGIDLGISMAFRLNRHVSVGGSMITQYVNAKTAVAINTVAACLEGFDADPEVPLTCDGIGIDSSTLGSDELDGSFVMEGHNTAIGYALGSLIEFSPQSRLGINYRSRIAHELTGTATVEFPQQAALFESFSGISSTEADGRVQLVTPETASLSYYQRLGSVALQADYSWTRWSRYDQIQVESSNATVAVLAAAPQVYDWTDSQRIAVGAAWDLSPALTLRGGLALDKTPIKDENTKVDFAFDDYKAISIGVSYQLQDNLTLDAGYQHTMTQQRDIEQNDLETAGALLSGEVTTKVNSFAAGLRWAL